MNRGSLATLGLLVVVVVASRWYLLRVSPEQEEVIATIASNYTLTNFQLRSMGDDGRPKFLVTGPFLRENSADGSASVTEPHLELFQNGDIAWSAEAQQGWVAPDGELVRLEGDVVMVSPSGQRDARIDAMSLEVRPTERVASSDETVRVTRPGIVLTGVGVDLDMNLQRIALRSAVKATYRRDTGIDDAAG